jgi:hypothetical protein
MVKVEVGLLFTPWVLACSDPMSALQGNEPVEIKAAVFEVLGGRATLLIF